MRPSQFLAVLAFLGLVPGGIWLSYAGHEAGLYPYLAVPIAFGIMFAVGATVFMAVLPSVRRRLD